MPLLGRAILPGNLQGVLWMLASGAGYTLHMALAREITAEAHPVFLAFWRSFLAFLIAMPFVWFGRVRIHTARLGALITRSLIGSAGFVFGLMAIWPVFGLTLAEFNALSFTRPLFVTLLAILFLKEKAGLDRSSALMLGFAGVLLMTLVPAIAGGETGDLVNPGSLFALMSSLCFAFTIVLIKSLSGLHTPLALLVWANLLSSLILLPFALFYAGDTSAADWGLIVLMALAGFIAQFCFIKGMSVADASFLSPIDYVRLPMGALADWLVIRVLPGPFVWLGAGIIITSTLWITLREHRQIRQKSHASP